MEQYQIGNKEPFKVTPTSSKKLVEAMAVTEAKLLFLGVDGSLPYLHIGIRLELPSKKVKKTFESILGRCLEDVPNQDDGFTFK
jgi:hypothetical protein